MTTPHELLERALKLACDIPELHEISYRMGLVGSEPVPQDQVRDFRRGQMIMGEATALAIEIEREMVAALASVPTARKAS